MAPPHNDAAELSRKRPLPAKDFIFGHYIRLFCSTALLSLLLVLSLMIYQARTLNKVYLEKSIDVIHLHRNELLNEIALSDFASLTQHLNYMLNEMNADYVVLSYEGRQYQSVVRGPQRPSFLMRMLSQIGGIRPFRIDIANEFGTFRAVLEVTYVQSLFAWVLSPVFLSVLLIAALSWVPVGIVFIVIFRRIRSNFIDPLNAVTASLRKGGLQIADAPQLADIVVEEIVQLQRACEQYRLVETEAAFAKIARQVTHDIRSPLAALDTLLSLIQDLPEEQRVLLRTAVGRIRDLSNNLLNKTKPSATAATAKSIGVDSKPSATASEYLAGLVESVISEKRQHRSHTDVEILFEPDASTYDVFVPVEPDQMRRVLSNLLDNALEALDKPGRISISLQREEQQVELLIRDNGRGIPAAILPTLMEHGRTYGKPGGSGLGLAYARECIDAWGGLIRLDSVEDEGTTISLQLPRSIPPVWFVSALQVSSRTIVVVIDDDDSIHEVWKNRIRQQVPEMRLIHCTNLDQLERFCEAHRGDSDDILYLCDFEFRGAKENGLSAIEQLEIAAASVLVTSRAEEPALRKRCLDLGVPLLPKSAAAVVPIHIR